MAKTEVKPEAAPEVEAVCVPCLESLRAERDAHLKNLQARQLRGHLDAPLTASDGVHRQTVDLAHQTALLEMIVSLLQKLVDANVPAAKIEIAVKGAPQK